MSKSAVIFKKKTHIYWHFSYTSVSAVTVFGQLFENYELLITHYSLDWLLVKQNNTLPIFSTNRIGLSHEFKQRTRLCF